MPTMNHLVTKCFGVASRLRAAIGPVLAAAIPGIPWKSARFYAKARATTPDGDQRAVRYAL